MKLMNVLRMSRIELKSKRINDDDDDEIDRNNNDENDEKWTHKQPTKNILTI